MENESLSCKYRLHIHMSFVYNQSIFCIGYSRACSPHSDLRRSLRAAARCQGQPDCKEVRIVYIGPNAAKLVNEEMGQSACERIGQTKRLTWPIYFPAL